MDEPPVNTTNQIISQPIKAEPIQDTSEKPNLTKQNEDRKSPKLKNSEIASASSSKRGSEKMINLRK